ncbi:hypothetical protein N431DRAFT_406266 [Stipitochalara longipes BDJ]|nr:hypothetical protein N431DRAFT_406266 [Stipitochalara longipes BDJ]
MASRYSLVDYDSDEERARHPNGPPPENLLSACMFMVHLLDTARLNYAVMGGFGLVIRGSPRPTNDVDIAVEARMANLWQLVEPQARLIIPNTRNIEGIMRIFVRTGPGHDQCHTQVNIEVDLVLCGALGTPSSLVGHRQTLTVTSRTGPIQVAGLELYYAMRGKLRVAASRAAQRDVSDVRWIIDTFPAQVQAFRARLDPTECDQFLEHFTGAQKARMAQVLGRTVT